MKTNDYILIALAGIGIYLLIRKKEGEPMDPGFSYYNPLRYPFKSFPPKRGWEIIDKKKELLLILQIKEVNKFFLN